MRDAAVGGDAVQVAVGQQALVERRERDEPFAELARGLFESVVFDGAVEHVVAVLVHDERHMHRVEQLRGAFERRAVVVRQSRVERAARRDGRGERAHRLLERRLRVHAVVVEHVHIVEPQPRERLVEARQQVLAAAAGPIGAFPHLEPGLGGDHELVAVRVQVPAQDLPEVAFRRAWFGAVVVGQVEIGDAVVKGGEHHLLHLAHRRQVAEIVPQAERHLRQAQAACAAAHIVHRRVARGVGCVDMGWFEHRHSIVSYFDLNCSELFGCLVQYTIGRDAAGSQ